MTSPFSDPSIAATYEDWYASPFGAFCDEREKELLREHLSALGAGPPATGTTLLDVGCGSGHFSRYLRAIGYDVIALDTSAAMLERARADVPVLRADALRLPLRDRSVDKLLVMAVIDYVDDPGALLREAARVARSGVLLVALQAPSSIALWRRLAALKGHAIFRHASFYSGRKLRRFAREAGLVVGASGRAIYLPPALAWRLPGLERSLSRWRLPGASLIALQLERRDDG